MFGSHMIKRMVISVYYDLHIRKERIRICWDKSNQSIKKDYLKKKFIISVTDIE